MDKRTSLDLIFNVAELARLFEYSEGLGSFLQRVVDTIAEHLSADVCSVYLYDSEGCELTLTATVGLAPDSVGNVKLKPGEGITGTAVKELRALRVGHGHEHPAFKFFEGIDEEKYEAFLAVPIMRGREAIGALTVQHRQQNYFTAEDGKALSAIAAQLASTIEQARFLLQAENIESGGRASDKGERLCPGFIKGQAGTSGIGHGQATVLVEKSGDYLEDVYTRAAEKESTLADFESALKKTHAQISELENMLEDRLGEESAALVFSGHQLMLADEGFSGYIRRQISEGVSPARATKDAVDKYVNIFSESKNPVLQEKTQDIRDLGYRLLTNLSGDAGTARDYENCVVIAKELLPSDIVKLVAQGVAGMVLLSGSLTSHVSVLAKSLELPLVVAGEDRLLNVGSGTEIIVDAYQGNVFVAPTEDIRNQYQELMQSKETLAEEADDILAETKTADGTRVHLTANINLCSDLPVAKRLKAEGVGLYRSEFPFIIRNNFPSEEEQLAVYKRILNEMEEKKVVFRTLDIGGDKVVSYAPSLEGNNPFMGLRAIRFSLKNRDIFSQQLRALLRAAAGRSLYVMFPMISSVDDFKTSKDLLVKCQEELWQEGVPCSKDIHTGLMVELPSAVTLIDVLAEEADFLSIGSNDLIQYLLAVDRTNQNTADFYNPFHPAVLRALQKIVEIGDFHKKPVSICGEIASEPRMIPFLLGIGLRIFSIDPRCLPQLQRIISTVKTADTEAIAEKALSMTSEAEIAELFNSANPEKDRS